jgi:hypothetical protein
MMTEDRVKKLKKESIQQLKKACQIINRIEAHDSLLNFTDEQTLDLVEAQRHLFFLIDSLK